MKKIVIADDHAVVREGLSCIINETGCFSVVGEANSIPRLRAVLNTNKIDIVLLDLAMPGGVGLEVLKEIKNNYPTLPTLIISGYSEEEYGLRAFKAGAAGYLSKECALEQLVVSLHEILQGRRYFSKATWALVSNELDQKVKTKYPHHDLSDRELHLFKKLGEGKSLTEISADLSLSIKTISTYRQRLLKKMQMTTNAQIVTYLISNDLIHSV